MTESIIKERKPALPVWARIVLVIIAYLIVVGGFQFLALSIMNIPMHNADALRVVSLKLQVFIMALGLIPLALVIYTFRKFLDRKSIVSLGFSLKNRFTDITAGFFIALLLFVGGSLFLLAIHSIGFVALQFNIYSLILSFILFTIVALNEEILFRGYILNNLMSSMNKYWALIISSVIFSVLHALNPNISLLALVNLMLAGIILGSTYIFTKNLWFPISLHLFWNFIQGPVLGYSVSGTIRESVFKVNLFGNSSINGGQFGFEGSLVCTVLLVVIITLILVYYLKYSIYADVKNSVDS